MADFNENITIDVKAKYDQLDGLQKKLMSVMDTLGSLGKGAPSSKLQNFWANSTNSIEEMTKSLDYAMKMVEKSQAKLREAQVGGQDTEIKNAQLVVNQWRDRERAVVKAIIHSEQYKNTLEQITQEYQKQQDAENQNAQVQAKAQELAQNAQAYLQKFLISLDPYQQKMAELNGEIAKACDEIIRLKSLDPEADVSQLEESVRQLKYEQEELKESTKQTASWWDKLLGRIRNIAIYRTIRRAMQIIVQLIKNGFNNVVKLSESASKLQQQLTANYNLISTALGATLYTLLQPLMPIIDAITDVFVGLVNQVNRFIAMLTGADKYMKVVRKDIKDTKKEVGLLSFDKFEALQKNNNDNDVLGVSVEEISFASEGLQNAGSQLKGIADSFGSIATFIGEIVEVIGNVLVIIAENLSPFIDFVSDVLTQIGGALDMVSAVFKALKGDWQGFVDLMVKGLKKMGESLVNMLIGFLNTVIRGLNLMLKPLDWIAGIFGAKAGTVQIPLIPRVSFFANGGIPTKGELFMMNEGGIPEALVNTGGSQTNVINIDQLSEGMRRGFTQAIYETGLIDAMQTRLVVDGSSVNDNAFARAIFPALKTESRRRGGNQL